eukprot:777927_1
MWRASSESMNARLNDTRQSSLAFNIHFSAHIHCPASHARISPFIFVDTRGAHTSPSCAHCEPASLRASGASARRKYPLGEVVLMMNVFVPTGAEASRQRIEP